jgi:hypothetical protein
MHEINFITGSVIDSAMRVHTALGPGLRPTDCRAGLLINFNETATQERYQAGCESTFRDVPARPASPRAPREMMFASHTLAYF